MAWIESHTVGKRHRKVRALARSLRIKPVYALGHLHALWHDALDQQENGDLSSWTDDLIAESSDYDGDAHRYVSLLRDHGWLDGPLIHDWLEYAGRYLQGKYRTSNPALLAKIWERHGKAQSVLSQSKDRPPDLPDLTRRKDPQPPLAGALAPRRSRANGSNLRTLGKNPRALAAKALAQSRKFVEHIPPEVDLVTDEDFTKMRKTLNGHGAK